MTTVSEIRKHFSDEVRVESTTTGRVVQAPVLPMVSLLLGEGLNLVSGAALCAIFNSTESAVLSGILLYLPVLLITGIFGLMVPILFINGYKNDVERALSPEELTLYVRAKKSLSLHQKFAMLFYAVRPKTLLSVEDPNRMTQTTVKLVRHHVDYFIEIEHLDALKSWDAAFESAAPVSSASAVTTEEANDNNSNTFEFLRKVNDRIMAENKNIFDEYMCLSDKFTEQQIQNKMLLEELEYYQMKATEECVCRPCAQNYKHKTEMAYSEDI